MFRKLFSAMSEVVSELRQFASDVRATREKWRESFALDALDDDEAPALTNGRTRRAKQVN